MTVRVALADWLREQPFTLALSSGFFAFYAHAGALAALEDAGIAPARVTGASAGALVGGMWAAGLDSARIADELFRLRREHFWDPGFGPGLLRGRLFAELLARALPVRTIEGCRVPLAISVFDLLALRTRALTAGPLDDAIRASCAVPGMFHPVWIGARPFADGGVLDRPALAGIPAGARTLLHHIPSRSRPWRRDHPPHREGLVALALGPLPKVGPFRLAVGRDAFEAARTGVANALRAPLTDATPRR